MYSASLKGRVFSKRVSIVAQVESPRVVSGFWLPNKLLHNPFAVHFISWSLAMHGIRYRLAQ
jgi:hypothetical protein